MQLKHFLKITIGVILLVVFITSVSAYALNPAPVPPISNQLVYFTNTNFQLQSVFYKGEEFYIVINLAQVFQGQPVYLTVTLSGPPGTETLYQGEVEGGYIYYGALEIVPPIYNGQTYTAYVTACLIVNNAITSECVTGSASYIEEDHPPAKIVSSPYIVNNNNQEETTLIGNNTYTLIVSIENTGYISYTYTVEVSDSAGLISAQSMQVTVPAQSEATVNVPIYVETPSGPVSDTVTVYVYGDGYLDGSSSVSVTVLPSRPGPFTIVSVSTTTLDENEQNTITIVLRNTGYTASDITATATSNIAPNIDVSLSTTQVSSGGELTVTLYLTPNTAGNGVITLDLTYSWPYTNNVYTDTFEINVTVLTELVINLVTMSGTPVNAVASINGQETNSLWVAPGTYVVSVPSTVSAGSGVRFVFGYWSNGLGSSNTVTVTVSGPTTLTAYYVEQYYVSITDPVTGKSVSGWFNEGSTVSLPSIPQFINYNNGSRLSFQGWSCGYPPSTTTITVNSPITCTAQWVMQYQVIVEDVITGLGGLRNNTVGTYWVDEGGNLSINALDYRPNGSNPIIPLTYSHAVIRTSTGSSTVSTGLVSLTVSGPATIELVWVYNMVNVIGLGAGVALLGLGVVYRDRVRYFTTIIIRRTTTIIRGGGGESGTVVRGVAEDGTRVYAQPSEELPVKPLDEGTRVRQAETVVRQGEETTKQNNESTVVKPKEEEQNKEQEENKGQEDKA
ncbi:COG1361 family protein [Vulcanisaeta sp. JCM 14467]